MSEIITPWISNNILKIIRFINTVLNIAQNSLTITKKIGTAVVKTFKPDIYIFFKGNMIPYHINDILHEGNGIAPIEWTYDANSYMFVNSKIDVLNTKTTLPWLSAEIKLNESVLYDLTDFINSIKYSGVYNPSLYHILSVWTIETGVVLDKKIAFTFETINEDGDTNTILLK